MTKIWAISLFLAAVIVAPETSAKGSCEPLPSGYRLLAQNYSVSELESLGLRFAARNPAVPQVPFAYAHRGWIQMRDLYRPGDELREFDSPHLGPGGSSPDGFVLMRGKCMISFMGLRIA